MHLRLIGDPPNIMIGSSANIDFNSLLFTWDQLSIAIQDFFREEDEGSRQQFRTNYGPRRV